MVNKVFIEDGETKVTITMKEYLELQETSAFMRALEAAGVDNWEGYGIAQDMMAEWQEKEYD